MVEWMKEKYRCRKKRGRYESTHSDSFKKKKKLGSGRQDHVDTYGDWVMVVTNGSKRMEYRGVNR